MRAFPFIVTLSLLLGACTTQIRQAVPPDHTDGARVVGLASDSIRMWGDEVPNDFQARAVEMHHQRRNARQKSAGSQKSRTEHILVLSGGGSGGAFGAGLLSGWTVAGSRPQFNVVTGVSTGALIAPFAFLGPKYDSVLRDLYTRYSTKDILTPNILAGLLGGGSAVSSSQPLAKLIAKYVDKRLLRKIAAEHARGRRLLVGTTNLDAERSVIWDMGKIASTGTNEALTLFRKVLLASASIPGLFPPVMINVNVDGKIHREMHVDGGTTDSVVLLPVQARLRGRHKKQKRKLYVIVNSNLSPEWKSVKSVAIGIAGRSIGTLIKQQTIGDVAKLHSFSKANQIQFHLASIPSDFKTKSTEPFDRKYMTALFDAGRKLSQAGYKWQSKPPAR